MARIQKAVKAVKKKRSSRFSGFYKLEIPARLDRLDKWEPLSTKEKWTLRHETLTDEKADMMIENVIGVFGLPLGLAVNFEINGKDYVIPMAVEETSIVAAAGNMAKTIRENGALTSKADATLMEGQIQLLNVPDPEAAASEIEKGKKRFLRIANKQDKMLVSLGGGAKDLVVRRIKTESGPMLICHLVVDVRDAMGANAVNTMAETIGPMIAELAKAELGCQIISNLCDKSLVRAKFDIDVDCLERAEYSGREVAERIVRAYHFADADPYRAATHNKGIMNGIDGILIATGNDWRAVEAGCHAYAAHTGRYRSLTRYRLENNRLHGEITVPIAVGLVGGVTKLHPGVQIVLKILGVSSRSELAEVIAAAGLVQNFAAMRSLVTEGIQQGHMGLHARNVAYFAGAFGKMAIDVAEQMEKEGRIRFDRAKEIIKSYIERKDGYK